MDIAQCTELQVESSFLRGQGNGCRDRYQQKILCESLSEYQLVMAARPAVNKGRAPTL